MYQLSPENLTARIQIGLSEVRTLGELLPHSWTSRSRSKAPNIRWT